MVPGTLWTLNHYHIDEQLGAREGRKEYMKQA